MPLKEARMESIGKTKANIQIREAQANKGGIGKGGEKQDFLSWF